MRMHTPKQTQTQRYAGHRNAQNGESLLYAMRFSILLNNFKKYFYFF